ncbi:MAG: DJ-1/PfpI family protein [Candidatus Melainabacteria bacterium]|nr:DJ-1/PfpI family protein [Candidatus Melainabacteria bacterium]
MTELRRILMVIAPEQFRDEELLVPRHAFEAAGFAVDTVSTRVGEATGMLGAKETIQTTLSQVSPANYCATVVVGGMGSVEHLWENEPLHQLLQAAAAQGQVLAAICLSSAVLAKAGLLQGKQATVWEMPESLEALKHAGAIYTGEPVTVDDNRVTANGPEAATAFAEAILARLQLLQPA